MLEIIWKISVVGAIGFLLFATLGVGLIWAAPRFEQKVMELADVRPRLMSALSIGFTALIWCTMGAIGFLFRPEDNGDLVAVWGARILFIGAPALVSAAISYVYFTNEEREERS